ncbi:kinase-like domain-containing protein [Neurospora crassa]|nr:kinase-like domain-containing protein [Neurospora crassa]
MEESYEYQDSGRQLRLGFWLLPFNKAAAALVSCHPHNLERYSYDQDTRGIWIDFSNPEKHEYTVGCSESVDIYLPQVWNSTGSSGISERHASFRAVTDTGPILLCDESEYLSTEPFSHGSHSYTVNFRREGERSVLVAQGINSLVAFGHGRFYQFELRWENDGLDEFRMAPPVLYALGPSRTKTKRYVLGGKVGGGTFGNVYRAMHVATGSVMAVKKCRRPSSKRFDFASREIATLLKINSTDESTPCDHIIQILGYTTTPDGWAELYLPLKSGNLKTLVSKILPPSSHFHVSNLVLHQMLLALHHLDQHSIIHRDLNPENILWEHSPFGTGDYHFTLADFGLSTSTSISTSTLPNEKNNHSKRTFFSPTSRASRATEVVEIAGTTPFMAPETYNTPLKQQTSKVDIWSLFATVVWVRDKRFRKECELVGPHLVHVWLNRIAGNKKGENGGYEAIRRMACFDPGRRPSAEEQLEILEMEEEAEMEELEEEMPYYRQDEPPPMTGAIGNYGWNGTDSAWSSEGYALPMKVPWDQEGWIPGSDGHYSLAKSPGDEADAAMAMWKAWYLATDG